MPRGPTATCSTRLTGEKIALGMPRADMLPEYHRWENDPAVVLGYGTQLPQSWETRAAGYEGQARSDRQASFEVIRLNDRQPIGMTVLQVDHQVRTAEYVILLAPNTAGITAYKRAGFRQAGRLRQAGYWLGEVVDELLMDAVREDFPGPSKVRNSLGS